MSGQMELVPGLGPAEARRLTDEIKHDAEQLWRKLVQLYEGDAHTVLGYPSWHAYCGQEFSFGRSQSYRLLDAGRIAAAVPQLGNEAQARELAPVLRQEGPSAVEEAVRELEVEFPGEKLTAARIKLLVRNRLSRKRREADIREAAEPGPLEGERYWLLHGDLLEVEIPRRPDVIITDPPYSLEYLDCYEKLARLAAEILPDGGSVVAMAGQQNLPRVHDLMSRHLSFHWELAWYFATHQKQRQFPRRVFNAWKPVVWYAKGEAAVRGAHGTWIRDVILNEVAPDKAYHEWGQSVSGMAELIEMFSRPGDVVLDPFVGGGSTAVAALGTGRRFIGIDVDEQAINSTAARIAEATT